MPIEWVTFDCYGTLIDWEGGVFTALRPLLPPRLGQDEVARRYIAAEAAIEGDEYAPYRDVLDRAGRAVLADLGRPLAAGERCPLPDSLAAWLPFPEVPPTLRALRAGGLRLAILSNVDRDLIAHSIACLGVTPDLVVTAEDCRRYKPDHGHWRHFERESGAGPGTTVHVAASEYHDIVPATALGYRTVYVNRHADPIGAVAPTVQIPDVASLPETIAHLPPR
ncbi:MAG: HAD hydrolase-like protein [Chloroflexota bacterium]|nr:HAD hydrolase-like protein [Chloroflexota bacterium]